MSLGRNCWSMEVLLSTFSRLGSKSVGGHVHSILNRDRRLNLSVVSDLTSCSSHGSTGDCTACLFLRSWWSFSDRFGRCDSFAQDLLSPPSRSDESHVAKGSIFQDISVHFHWPRPNPSAMRGGKCIMANKVIIPLRALLRST